MLDGEAGGAQAPAEPCSQHSMSRGPRSFRLLPGPPGHPPLLPVPASRLDPWAARNRDRDTLWAPQGTSSDVPPGDTQQDNQPVSSTNQLQGERERERDHRWTSVNTYLNNNQENNLLRQSGILNSDYLTALKHQGFS